MVLNIYFGDKPVFLCDEITPLIESFRHRPDTVFIDEIEPPAIKTLLHEIAKPECHSGILFSRDMNLLKKNVWKHFTVIEAAGGLISNEKDEILMIFRRGKWDLPKGKKEEDEDAETCAIREVKEETGLQEVQLKEFLITTYHTYNLFGKSILKETHWYKMETSSLQSLKPQTEEEISDIEWVNRQSLNEKLKNTFPSVKEVILTADENI